MANDDVTGIILKSIGELRTDIRGLYQKIDDLGKVYVTKEVHEKVVEALSKRVHSLENDRTKFIWIILAAVGMAVLSLVLDTTHSSMMGSLR